MIPEKHKVFFSFLELANPCTWEATDTFVMQVCRLKLPMSNSTRLLR